MCVEDDTALRPIGGADLPGEHSSFPAMFESGQSEGLSDATFAQNTISSVRSPETYVSKFYAFRNVRQSSAAGAKELNSISLFFSHKVWDNGGLVAGMSDLSFVQWLEACPWRANTLTRMLGNTNEYQAMGRQLLMTVPSPRVVWKSLPADTYMREQNALGVDSPVLGKK